VPAEQTYRLRIAILCRGLEFEAWEAECIRQVLSLDFVTPVLLIAQAEQTQTRSFTQKVLKYPSRRLWKMYDRRLKIKERAPVQLNDLPGSVPLIRCTVEQRGKYSQYFSEADIQTIRSHGPDIILRFGFDIIRGEILTVAPYGVWSFHHADEQHIRGGPGGFWEIMLGHPATGAILQRLSDKLDAGIVLRKGWFGTLQHSYAANLSQLLSGTTGWMRQVCIDIRNGRADYFNAKPVETKAKIYSFPTNAQMIRFRFRLLANKLKFHWQELFRPEHWNVGIVRKPYETAALQAIPPNVEWLREDAARIFKADPFGFIENGKEVVLYEKYDYALGRGIIAAQIDGKESHALETEKHLSFPFVLQQDGKTFVLPEANNSGEAVLYEWKNGRLENPRTLLPFPLVDANIVFYKDRYWLFCTREDEGPNHHLHIYFSDKLEGEWRPHANNPVKCDIRSARPAGAAFVKEGRLYRPGQDCTPAYGSAVVVHEVLELSETVFREAAVQRIEPHASWKLSAGLHHVAPLGNEAMLFDAKRYAFNSANFKRVLKRKLKRLGGGS